jgi:Caspase domain
VIPVTSCSAAECQSARKQILEVAGLNMIKLDLGALGVARYALPLKYALPLAGLVAGAFAISVALEKLAAEKAEAAFSQAAPSGRDGATASRVALVIGNADYPDANAPLRHPGKDARALADELRRKGFDVDVQENLGKAEMKRAFEHFKMRIRPGSVALVSFGGFGIQIGRQSYVIPVDAQIWREADVRREGVGIDAVLADMHNRGATVKLAILDASRRNPFERRFRGLSAGLAAIDAPPGTLLMSAAAPGKVAYDAEGEHSLLVGELLKEINAPGVSAEVVFNHTKIGVSRSSNGEQVPLVASSLVENFMFVTSAPRYTQADRAEAPAKAPPPAPLDSAADAGPLPTKTSAAPRAADASPDKTVATNNAYDRASRPDKPASKEPRARTEAKPAEDAKLSRRPIDDFSREIMREQPRMIIRRGGLHSSSCHANRPVRVAALPRRRSPCRSEVVH